jgi:hypothetical protein
LIVLIVFVFEMVGEQQYDRVSGHTEYGQKSNRKG